MTDSKRKLSFIEMEAALLLLFDRTACTTRTEDISIYEAAGRIAAQNYETRLPGPPFNRSPLDGYALFHGSFPAAVSEEMPARFRITMRLYAGDCPGERLEPGCAARIMTGAMIPEGADCVVRQEDTDCGEEAVQIYHKAEADENICFAGEDVGTGALIVQRGEKLTPAVISVLAGQGYYLLTVYDKLNAGIISTGSELVGTGRGLPLAQGKIYDSNGPMICARLMELGINCRFRTVEDDMDKIAGSIKEFVQGCDAVITTGGVSVGEKDYLSRCMELCGAEIVFHGVAMKPGSPMLAAMLEEKPVFCLSGNPFAAFACLELLTLPVLLRMSGRSCYVPVRTEGRLRNDFPKKSGGRRFIRGRYSNPGIALPQNHSSGSIAGSIGCNCFVDIPAGSGILKKGSLVNAVLFVDGSEAEEKDTCSAPVYAVSGFHKTGKTTVLEEAIRHLKKAGCCVAVIKHDGHSFEADVPGTDSHRLKKAGAAAVMVVSDSLQAMVQDISLPDMGVPDMNKMIADMTKRMEKYPDIVLLEGFKSAGYPMLLLEEKETDRGALLERGRQLAEYLMKEVIR